MRLQLQVRSDDKGFGGESWLWERDGFRVVVDIGSAPEFRARAASFSPNVVVLTHDDVDHIAGKQDAVEFIRDVPRTPDLHLPDQFLPDVGRRQVEFWLPMDWLHLAHALLQVVEGERADGLPQTEVEPTVEREVNDHEYTLRYFEPNADELNYKVRRAESQSTDHGDAMALGKDVYGRSETSRLGQEMAALGNIEGRSIRDAVYKVIEDYRNGASDENLTDSAGAIADRAEESAVRVGGIIAELAKRQLPVRFFDVDRAQLRRRPLWPDQGLRGIATIINAVETPHSNPVRFRKPALALLFASRLTIQNQRALATFLWPTDRQHWYCSGDQQGGDGMIIWSDTTGEIASERPARQMVPWRHVGVMSAPHHASADVSHRPLWSYRPSPTKVILSNNSTENASEWKALATIERDCADCGRRRHSTVGARSLHREKGVSLFGQCWDDSDCTRPKAAARSVAAGRAKRVPKSTVGER